MTEPLHPDFFAGDTLAIARDLLGVTLQYNDCEGTIVETEAYRDDAASHAVTKPVKGAMLRETYGCIYIFFIYGMYHCLNVTTERDGVGAVLIRAVEPTKGIAKMKRRRGTERLRNLTNGPGKLFQAFGMRPEIHGEPVGRSIRLLRSSLPSGYQVRSGPRIGISKATDLEWRFYVAGNAFVSK